MFSLSESLRAVPEFKPSLVIVERWCEHPVTTFWKPRATKERDVPVVGPVVLAVLDEPDGNESESDESTTSTHSTQSEQPEDEAPFSSTSNQAFRNLSSGRAGDIRIECDDDHRS